MFEMPRKKYLIPIFVLQISAQKQMLYLACNICMNVTCKVLGYLYAAYDQYLSLAHGIAASYITDEKVMCHDLTKTGCH